VSPQLNSQKDLTGSIRDHIVAQLSEDKQSVPVEVLAHYIASSYLALLTWWLDHDLPYTAEQMDAMFEQLVIPGIREMLGAAR
jgi:hypothetical protein